MVESLEITRKTEVIEGASLSDVDFQSLIKNAKPVILKGIMEHTPICQKAKSSVKDVMSFLLDHYNGRPVTRFVAEPEIGGRFFYNRNISGFNYKSDTIDLGEAFSQMERLLPTNETKAQYIGSTSIDGFFPDLMTEAELVISEKLFEQFKFHVSIWMGNETTAAAHYDFSNNIAACLAGRRRFTLFPPDQTANLYPGPLEPTPGGQVVSMVDFQEPDFEAHPNFEKAVQVGEIAELGAGDVLVYPAMWWHQVEALDPFNVLVNYWWNEVPSFIDDPVNMLYQGMLSLRDRPDYEKKAWRELLDYYVFGDANLPRQHLPEHAQGPLAPLDDLNARRLRARLLQRLNR